jgi:seryl-tRNA synthetase
MDNDIKFKLDYISEKCLHFENVNRELSTHIKFLQDKIKRDRTAFEQLLKQSQEEINQHIEKTKELSSKIKLIEDAKQTFNESLVLILILTNVMQFVIEMCCFLTFQR